MAILANLFGNQNERLLKKYKPLINTINGMEKQFANWADGDFKKEIHKYQQQLQQELGKISKTDKQPEWLKREKKLLDELLPKVFALTREAAKRTLGLRHFDVQLLGGMVLHDGAICEMKTGEGKTLVATLAVVLNALSQQGVHVVTVNDYLARRDAEWMGKIYEFLGLSYGVIIPHMPDNERKKSYLADITYATNNELGFDYLRDNLKHSLTETVQRGHHFAIVDEVDSILIDEARTPLIISGPTDETSELYYQIDKLIPSLKSGDYELNEKDRNITLSETGHEHLEQLLRHKTKLMKPGSLFDFDNLKLLHHADQALRAHHLFKRDRDYVVKDGKVIIVDEFTGRMMQGRRYADGLHQALEAKEKLAVEPENQTIASITFQNYFRLYNKLSGMTGTALTEATEFGDIYHLNVIAIPTHQPSARLDANDEIYRTNEERDEAVVKEIISAQQRGQPVLVGTVSIEKSEKFAKLLEQHQIPCNVLNARLHEKEAEIIAEAGVSGRVTIATNMAGRGTDIQLGGNKDLRLKHLKATITDKTELKQAEKKLTEEIANNRQKVLAAGGLYIIGTERHESRRIDNQLRGRAGRQGDKGASKFFISLQDDLMRIFGSDRMDGMLQKLGLQKGEAITHAWITKALEKAQGKVEERNFEIRKHLLKYDDVMNDQRRVIFDLRKQIMQLTNINPMLKDFAESAIDRNLAKYIPTDSLRQQWQLKELNEFATRYLGVALPLKQWETAARLDEKIIKTEMLELFQQQLNQQIEKFSEKQIPNIAEDAWKNVSKSLFLQVLDHMWKEHLRHLDHLRSGINLRAYGMRDPLHEYKQEAFAMFAQLLEHIQETTLSLLLNLRIAPESEQAQTLGGHSTQQLAEKIGVNRDGTSARGISRSNLSNGDTNAFAKTAPTTLLSGNGKSVGRNAPCPCGSGKKYKHCHGKIAK